MKLNEKFSVKLLLIGVIVFIIGTVLFFWKDPILNLDSKVNSEKIAQFGDFIGGIIGSIWALAGVILFYVALKEQQKDLSINRKVLEAQLEALNIQIEEFKLQKIELQETRIELRRTANAQEKSEIAFVNQIKAMNKSSIINAYSAQINHYSQRMAALRSANQYSNEEDAAIKRLLRLLDIEITRLNQTL